MTEHTEAPIIVYGGNGFVGTAICELIVGQGIPCTSISRRGFAPAHLRSSPWVDKVHWVQGDALSPDPAMLNGARGIINLVGSPPLPTFSQAAFDHQLLMVGTSQVRVIHAAQEARVNRLVVMGADIPSLLQTESFAYYLGKKQALTAAKTFAASSKLRQAAVLKPAGIYGTRYTSNGMALPLSWVMSPLSGLQRCLPRSVQSVLPAAFVDVKKVAGAAVEWATTVGGFDDTEEGFIQLTNEQLLQWSPELN